MRVLIQNCLTSKFFSPKKTWVSDPEKAEDFQKTLRAWSEIDERKLSGVRIVLNLGDGVPDVALANVGTEEACGEPSGFKMAEQPANPVRDEL
jgi:hypothetical protein